MTKKVLSATFVAWLPLAITIVIFSGLAYVVVQQNYRQSANDPQIQIAEDLATAIAQGQPADQIVPAQGTTELANTLSPFVMIYSASSTLVGSSALLGGKNPSFPTSVFDSVRTHGQWRQTWQPAPGVREAVVVEPFSGTSSGFLVVGRSLKEIEIRENQTERLAGLAGILALVLTFIFQLFFINRAMKPRVLEEVTLDVKLTETSPKEM
jgi:hypothetical protein